MHAGQDRPGPQLLDRPPQDPRPGRIEPHEAPVGAHAAQQVAGELPEAGAVVRDLPQPFAESLIRHMSKSPPTTTLPFAPMVPGTLASQLSEERERFRLLVDGVKDYAIMMLDT